MATILGTVGVFGFDSDQQGILLESQDIDYKPDSKAGAAVKASLNALNTAGNITRDFLIRRTNDERPKRKHKKKSKHS